MKEQDCLISNDTVVKQIRRRRNRAVREESGRSGDVLDEVSSTGYVESIRWPVAAMGKLSRRRDWGTGPLVKGFQ